MPIIKKENIRALENVEESILNLLHLFSADARELLNKSNLVKPLIKNLLMNEYIKDICLTKEVENVITEDFYKSKKLYNSEDIKNFLKSEGKSHKEIVKEVTFKKKIQNYSLNKFDKEIVNHFKKRKDLLDQYIYSLIRVKDENLAKELYFRIEEKEFDFAEIASIYSEGKEKYSRGIIGPTTLKETHPLLKKHIISSEKRVIEYPVNIDKYWVITRIEEYWPPSLDSTMKVRLSVELFQNDIDTKAKSILMKYKLLNSKSIN